MGTSDTVQREWRGFSFQVRVRVGVRVRFRVMVRVRVRVRIRVRGISIPGNGPHSRTVAKRYEG